jgi:hypothetical protein
MGMPISIYLPQFYATELELSLVVVGAACLRRDGMDRAEHAQIRRALAERAGTTAAGTTLGQAADRSAMVMRFSSRACPS